MRKLMIIAVVVICGCSSVGIKFDPQNIATWPKCAYPLVPETTNERCQVGDEDLEHIASNR